MTRNIQETNYQQTSIVLSDQDRERLDELGAKLGTKTRTATIRQIIKNEQRRLRKVSVAVAQDRRKKKEYRSDWDKVNAPRDLGEYLQARENLKAQLRLTRGED